MVNAGNILCISFIAIESTHLYNVLDAARDRNLLVPLIFFHAPFGYKLFFPVHLFSLFASAKCNCSCFSCL